MTERRTNRIAEPLRQLKLPGTERRRPAAQPRQPAPSIDTTNPAIVEAGHANARRHQLERVRQPTLGVTEIFEILGVNPDGSRQDRGRLWLEGYYAPSPGKHAPRLVLSYQWSDRPLCEWFITPHFHPFLQQRLQLLCKRLLDHEEGTPRDITAIDSNALIWIRGGTSALGFYAVDIGYLGESLIVQALNLCSHQNEEEACHQLNAFVGKLAMDRLDALALEEQQALAEQLGVYGQYMRKVKI